MRGPIITKTRNPRRQTSCCQSGGVHQHVAPGQSLPGPTLWRLVECTARVRWRWVGSVCAGGGWTIAWSPLLFFVFPFLKLDNNMRSTLPNRIPTEKQMVRGYMWNALRGGSPDFVTIYIYIHTFIFIYDWA